MALIDIGIVAALVAVGLSINVAILVRLNRRKKTIQSISPPKQNASEANVDVPISTNRKQ